MLERPAEIAVSLPEENDALAFAGLDPFDADRTEGLAIFDFLEASTAWRSVRMDPRSSADRRIGPAASVMSQPASAVWPSCSRATGFSVDRSRITMTESSAPVTSVLCFALTARLRMDRQAKGAATDMFSLPPLRHTPTLLGRRLEVKARFSQCNLTLV
jgi:hypothetical protein